MKANKAKILVTSVGSGVGQSIIKSIKLANIAITLIGADADPINASVYFCDKGYLIPPINNATYFPQLLEIIRLEKPDVIIPAHDAEILILARRYQDILQHGCIPLVCGLKIAEIIRDKFACYKFFHDSGFPFVKTVMISDIADLVEDVGFPVIVKPNAGSGSNGIEVITDYKQVDFLLKNLDRLAEAYIAQEYLVPVSWGKKRAEIKRADLMHAGNISQRDEVSIQTVLSKNGDVLGCFISKNELKAGIPIKIFPFHDHELEEIAIRIGKHLFTHDLFGPCNLQCKITEKGPIFFEVNCRFTGITGMRAAMGFNECEAVIKDILFGESAEEIKKVLQPDYNLCCVRYVAEAIMTKEAVDSLRRNKSAEKKGKLISL